MDTNNKKIIFISAGISEELLNYGITGGEVRLAEIIRGALKDNLKVHLLTNTGADLFCRQFNLAGVKCHSLNYKIRTTRRLGFILLTLKTLFFPLPQSLLDFDQCLIYSANDLPWDVFLAIRLKLYKNRKWVAVVHWLPPLKFWQRKKTNPLNSLVFMLGERISLLLIKYFADLVLAVSESTNQQLKRVKFNMAKVMAVECGINFNQILDVTQKIKEKIYDAVYMKRIHAVKGIFDLIEAWQKVVENQPAAKLIIIGGGFDNQNIINLIKEKDLSKNIIFAGFIFDFEKKIQILSQSKIFILPTYEENWAIVIGEAMACGLPVISYELEELKDVWQDAFVPVPVGNVGVLTERIIEFLKDQDLRSKIGESGQNYVKQFDWQKIAQREIELIKSL